MRMTAIVSAMPCRSWIGLLLLLLVVEGFVPRTALSLRSFTDSTISSTLFSGPISVASSSSKPISVLICPAQFCVPVDYDDLVASLQKELGAAVLGSCKVAPLPRTEWIKVAQSLPTKEYLSADLKCYKTLSWYFDAIEAGLAEIFAEQGQDAEICLIGHSIGGWITRAYLGGLSK